MYTVKSDAFWVKTNSVYPILEEISSFLFNLEKNCRRK
jgi:hypothetical protein